MSRQAIVESSYEEKHVILNQRIKKPLLDDKAVVKGRKPVNQKGISQLIIILRPFN